MRYHRRIKVFVLKHGRTEQIASRKILLVPGPLAHAPQRRSPHLGIRERVMEIPASKLFGQIVLCGLMLAMFTWAPDPLYFNMIPHETPKIKLCTYPTIELLLKGR